MSEKKKVVSKEWEVRNPKGFSAGYTISQIRKIENCFDTCDNLLHQIGLNLGYSSKRSKFINAIEDISAIINYVNEIVYEIVGTIDIPLKDSFNSGATETISRIHVEDIETSNTIGVKEAYGKYDSAKGVYISGQRTASKLKFKDFIGGGKVGGKYREKFIELFKEDYENITKAIKENDKNGVLSYDKYIEYLINDGEFDHKVNQPFKSFVSGLLDLTIIKPIIEAYTGTDLITGEDLTDLERGLKGVGAVIDIFTLGQAMTLAKGAEAGISKMLKTVAVEGLSNVAGYTAAEISNAYDMPPLVSMIVSLGAGITASKVGCKYIIKDSSGKVIQEISEEVAKNIDNTSNTTSIKENILKNVEESRIAREASEYKSFIEFESGLTKGVTQAETSIISDEMRNKILEGQRKNPKKNELIGGHSPKINNSNPNYAVEDISINADGTRKVKFTTQFSDGNLAKIKTSTLFPEAWSDNKIIESIKTIGDTPSIGVRPRDGATLHRGIIDGVQIEVIKIGNNVTSGYPTGGGVSELLAGFK